jgi:ABC-2 type transport system ATP-binding protein
MTAVIEARGLGKRYRRLWALSDCTLSVPAGHVVGLVGPNGAGKTTLLGQQGLSVVLSSHLVGDLERVCDYLIVLVGSRVRLAGPVEELLARHHLLSGPRRDPGSLPDGMQVISASHTDVQSTLLVRTSGPVLDPAWMVSEVTVEDLVLAYMSQAAGRRRRNHLEVQR